MSDRLVSDLMTTEVQTVTPDASLMDLGDIFDRFDVRHVPVVDDDGDLIGLVSDRDLLRNVLTDQTDVPLSVRESSLSATRVDAIMTVDLVTLEPNDSAQRAARLLLDNKFGCVPIVEGGSRLVGIVTQSDFLRLYADGEA